MLNGKRRRRARRIDDATSEYSRGFRSIDAITASIARKNSAASPTDRFSYHPAASTISFSAPARTTSRRFTPRI
jgi:hypothetical protein